MKNSRIKYNLKLFKRINTQQYMINEYDLFKKTEFDNSKLSALDMELYTASYLDTSKYPFSKPPYNTPLFPSQSGVDPYILWNYLNHNYYKNNIDEKKYNESIFIDQSISRTLYENSTVLNIGKSIYKNSIKPGSLKIIDKSSKTDVTLIDDGDCNVIIQNTASFSPVENLLIDLSFNEKYKYRIASKKTGYLIQDSSIYKNNAIPNKELKYVDGFTTTGSYVEPVGTQVLFEGSQSIELKNIAKYKLKENDYAISFWMSASAQPDDSEFKYLVCKQELTNLEIKEKSSGVITYKYKKILTGNFPFSIKLMSSGSNAGYIYFSRLGGDSEYFVTSSTPITDKQHHILCQKSGSKLQLYIDGVKDSETEFFIDSKTDNTSPIFIGSLNGENYFYTGKLDEFKLYNTALTDVQILSLSDNNYETCYALQSNKIGNVFYKHGDIIISTINPKYKNIFLGHDGNKTYTSQSMDTGFSVEFRGANKLYEHEIVCRIPANEFNFSSNPTLKINNYTDSEKFKPFVTGSDFKLYFTTIGLYNDNYELVAIAKLSNPLPKYEDKDLNIIVKFDVD
jgi:hypothetical protein